MTILLELFVEFVVYGIWRSLRWWSLLIPVNVLLVAHSPSLPFFWTSVGGWAGVILVQHLRKRSALHI